jgi:hypothetical protein
LPPRPGFVFQLTHDQLTADILVDLHNAGWIIRCADERYWGFHFAGEAVRELAKSLFPEFASPDPSAVWRKSAFVAGE